MIDRADPTHIEVIWDRDTTFAERRQARRDERLAQASAQRPAGGIPADASSAAHVLSVGQQPQVFVQRSQRLGVQDQQGHDMYALTLSVLIEGRDPYTVTVGNPVPPSGLALIGSPAALPARVLPENPGAVVIDWAAVPH